MVNPVIGATVVLSAATGWWFALHPQPLLLGTVAQQQMVPWWYQLSAFPPFFLWLGSFLVRPFPVLPRVALLVSSSLVAVVRLMGFVPLSGHALFLSASTVFAWRCELPLARLSAGLSVLGLLQTWAYKWIWNDLGYCLMSSCIGACIGWACSLPRQSNRQPQVAGGDG